ncbi:hypothetical protein CKM354_001233700 [Cercospora kikuchii]|uniref:DUF7730 domain-containing protein n=1 Tax=Cercospora kikuchii TaxID=84275 RepID=A0A9P3FLU9_9PEZI|nr:uncharacterized protein CKM354_001233700 [Cercospora kikuchii]GIZ49305.1 hypothetical protein CKM354_001233700 [Cercospora kikuchii]
MELATSTGSQVLSQPIALSHAQAVTPKTSPTSIVVSFREEISEVIAPWRYSTEKPPFTVGEMAVFAIIQDGNDKRCWSTKGVHRLSVKNVQAWILRTFSYYNELAIKAVAHHAMKQRHSSYSVTLKEIVEGFPENLRDFDLPVFVKAYESHRHWANCKYSITSNAARVYLRRWLEPARHGIFRFLDLAPELRNRIYEVVLRFPDAGINLTRTGQLQIFRLDDMQRSALDPYWASDSDVFITHHSPSEILALLRTCKKIHREASSVFYGVNSFRFETLKCLPSALLVMPPSTQMQVVNLHIRLETSDETFNYMILAGQLLGQLSPKRLKFTFEPRHWLCTYDRKRRSGRHDLPHVDTFEMVEELKPFIDLARRAEVVEIFEKRDTFFKDFVASQLAVQATSSSTVLKEGVWEHSIIGA